MKEHSADKKKKKDSRFRRDTAAFHYHANKKKKEQEENEKKQEDKEPEASRRKKVHKSILGNAKQKSSCIKRGGALAKVWRGGEAECSSKENSRSSLPVILSKVQQRNTHTKCWSWRSSGVAGN